MANVNDMGFNQLATVLNSITEEVTGRKALTPTNTGEFISVAQKTLKAGYDPVLGAINQMITRTIFSNRPYERKFAGLQVSNQRFGSITRKLSIADKPFENDGRFEIVDGQAIDHWKTNLPNVLQMNFYGENVFEKSTTIFRDQLDAAFTGPDQFGEFISMQLDNVSNMIEQAHESTARSTIANFIGGKIAANNGVIHLLTEYNTKTGLSLTAQTVYQPENFKPFMEWVFSRIEELSMLMSERTSLFQIEVTGKPIIRHTPRSYQKVYLYAPAKAAIDARVLTNEYHDNYLKFADNEGVTFWQNPLSPDSISVTPTYLTADGSLTVGENTEQANIFGVMFDRDAMGYTVMNQWTASTNMNAKGGYINSYWHFTEKYWNDFTEKGIILLLD